MKSPDLSLVSANTTVFWFRRDLRIEDNAGLYYALKSGPDVLPMFIFDSLILGQLDDKHDIRVDFIHQSIATLKAQLESLGSSLLVLFGDPVSIFKKINPKAVFTNHDYEPYAVKRDSAVKKILDAKRITFNTYKDHVIFEKSEIAKPDGKPYTIFTPYSRRWKEKLSSFYMKPYPTKKYTHNLLRIKKLDLLNLLEIGFEPTDLKMPERIIKNEVITDYHIRRNFPAIKGTSRLSVHLRFGTVSIRKLVNVAKNKNETWLNELIWREFYQMILWNFPQVETKAFKPAYDQIAWRNDVTEFEAWCAGKTGYPIVDAGMRELNATGFMHNRVRMITASFLTKHLLIDWQWGEAYFAKKLLDFDMASNNGGWQWAAGCGCDAAPYFRVFNPESQAQKFDPENVYISKWVPEFQSPQYPRPIVDHKLARVRALKTYQAALQNVKP